LGGGSNIILASPSFTGDPTFGQTLPPNYQWTSMIMPVACTFDSLTVNLSNLILLGDLNFNDKLTVTLMAQTQTEAIPGISITRNGLDIFSGQWIATATGSMAIPAGSYVLLQITGPILTDILLAPPSTSPTVIDVTSHCS
jgi:hypothetical protein